MSPAPASSSAAGAGSAASSTGSSSSSGAGSAASSTGSSSSSGAGSASSATASSGAREPGTPAAPEGSLLTAYDLRKTYGTTPALDGASFSIHAGEVVAVMGPSGSGKSTLLHCLAGIVPADSGTITYQGRDVTELSDGARSTLRRTDFGFVFQFGQLVPELTCLENVALPLRLSGTRRKEAERIALEWMERLEVTDVRAQRPGEVSGGQGQRIAVARSLVTSPRVLFADEPTGALDSLNGERVMELLTDAARSAGTAVVLVTHEVRVAAYSDREVVVRDGRTRDMDHYFGGGRGTGGGRGAGGGRDSGGDGRGSGGRGRVGRAA